MKKYLIVIIILIPLFSLSVLAESNENDVYDSLFKASGIEETKENLPETVTDIMKLWKIGASPNDVSNGVEINDVFSVVIKYFTDSVKNPAKALAVGILTVFVCAVFGVFEESSPFSSGVCDYVATLCISVVFVVPLLQTVTRAAGGIVSVGNFMLCFVPVFAGLLMTSGKTATAVGYSTAAFTVCEATALLGNKFVLPVCEMLLGVNIASTASNESGLFGISNTLKKICVWGLGIGMFVFTAVISLTGAVNTTADSMTLKTAKYISTGTVPFVGGAFAEALSVVAANLDVMKTSAGVYGVVGVLLVLLPVVCELLLWKAVLSFMSSISDMFSVNLLSELFLGVGGVISLLISLTLCAGVLFVISFLITLA